MESAPGLPGCQRKPGKQPAKGLDADDRKQRRTIARPPASNLHQPEQARNKPAVSRTEHEVGANNFAAVAENQLFGNGTGGAGNRGRVISHLGFKNAAVGTAPVNTARTDIDQPGYPGFPALLNDVTGAGLVDRMGKARLGAHIGCCVDDHIRTGQEGNQAPRDGNVSGRNGSVVVS